MMKLLKQILLALGLALFLAPAQADMIATGELHQSSVQTMDATVLRQQVYQQFVKNGIESELASHRVAVLTDAQLLELNGNLTELPAGAGVSTTDLLLIILLLVLL